MIFDFNSINYVYLSPFPLQVSILKTKLIACGRRVVIQLFYYFIKKWKYYMATKWLKTTIITLFCFSLIILWYIGYRYRLHITLDERYPVCYSKLTHILEKIYNCEIINDNAQKKICWHKIPEDELVTLEPLCEKLLDEVDFQNCSNQYYDDIYGVKSLKCRLDQLWYEIIDKSS